MTMQGSEKESEKFRSLPRCHCKYTLSCNKSVFVAVFAHADLTSSKFLDRTRASRMHSFTKSEERLMTLNLSVYRSRLKFGDRTKNGSSTKYLTILCACVVYSR